MVLEQRGTPYIATVVDHMGGPIIEPAGGPAIHGLDGYELPRPMTTRATLPYGVQLRVMLNTTPHGPAWTILEGPHRGASVPHHHPSWSVNPLGPPVPIAP